MSRHPARPSAFLLRGMALSSSHSAVFGNCPMFLLFVVLCFVAAEVNARLLGATQPYESVSIQPLLIVGAAFSVFFSIGAKPRNRDDLFCVISAGMIIPLSYSIMPAAAVQTALFFPHTYDATVLALDATLGVQPSIEIGKLFQKYYLVGMFCEYCYDTVSYPILFVAMMEALVGRRTGPGALPTFLVVAVVGFGIYHFLPVAGPGPYLQGAFPFIYHPPFLRAPRNCMPSLHTAWVVIAFWTTRGMPLPIRLIVGLHASATILATSAPASIT